MNIRQLHIAIQQELQRIDANATTYFQPPEIDLAINQEVRKFVKQRYVPQGNKYMEGFEESSKRIEDLRKLVVTDYIDNTFISSFDDSVVKFPLPKDHFLLSRARARSSTDGCNSPISTKTVTNNFSYVAIDTGFTNNISGKLNSFSLNIINSNNNTVPITSSAYNNNIATSFWFPEDATDFIFSIENDTVSNSTQGEAHHEVYKNVSMENTLIVVVPDTATSVQLTYTQGEDHVNKIYDTIKSSSYSEYQYDGNDSDLKVNTTRARFSQSHDIDKLLADPHNTTRPTSPLFTVRDNYIDVYQDEEFFVDKFVIDYVRMPKRVSYERNQDLELPEHTHDEIVKATASYLAAMAADQRYKYLESESRDSE